MNLTIRYFGLLAEIAITKEEVLDFGGSNVGELKAELVAKYPGLENRTYQVAHSGEIATDDTLISADVIALLPPYAGG